MLSKRYNAGPYRSMTEHYGDKTQVQIMIPWHLSYSRPGQPVSRIKPYPRTQCACGGAALMVRHVMIGEGNRIRVGCECLGECGARFNMNWETPYRMTARSYTDWLQRLIEREAGKGQP